MNEAPKISVTVRRDADAPPLLFVRWRLVPIDANRTDAPLPEATTHGETNEEP